MSKVLHGLLLKYVYWYIDNILIITPTFELCLEVLQLIFDHMHLFRMLLKLTKCLFIAAEMLYLGFIISSEGLKLEPAKRKMIADSVDKEKNSVEKMLNWTAECQQEFKLV